MVIFLSFILSFMSPAPHSGTFSIVACDTLTREVGVAVASKFLAVGSAVPFAEAEVGAVATQAYGNMAFGPIALDLLKKGVTPDSIIKVLQNMDTLFDQRQVGIVSISGASASWTGKGCSSYAGHRNGFCYAIQGNILVGDTVIKAMENAFLNSSGDLPERLIAALEAGDMAGGDARGRQSAALLVMRKNGGYAGYSDRYVDIRVDDHPDPIPELKRIYKLWERFFLLDAHGRIGDQYAKENKTELSMMEYQQAMKILNEVMQENPDDPDLLNEVAWFMVLRGIELNKAKELIDKALEIKPDDANILDTAALIYFKLGFKKKAIEFEQKAVHLDPENKYFKDMLEKFKKGKI
ncbi:MAG TPA: DUF1028 domain-containing protein [Candidatus Hydrothermia bacterium]|nr:DUF1028 domain-containing protein [Candidatus Hydrothermae bacterium]MDD3649227.1 DUF1028 domain-containing protein [Candidatus Hydrothermia bacterium]MDD5572431.1 DUF1028 domain-containing protein [Candidatus Hydrothermia bacterium]HOK22642.1 DUF1028 domain-containing protein [Candidatus Hydrothermia bacterium]HOL23351.1 DUF1028 domain-containing protein [Candidatus Hydrothermia bacterium]